MKNAARIAAGVIALIVLVVVAYMRVWQAGFIWDDDAHLTNNPCIVGPFGLTEIWTTPQAVYYPLVLTTFWALHQFAGLNPLPYHLLNVALHAANALLLWRVLRDLRVRGAWRGAALWALHPVMVQSVAWITEAKNTESCFFYLLCVLFFVKWNANRRAWSFLLALLFAVAAMTSKTSTVVLPAVLALCLWWQNRRIPWRDIAALLPFFALAAAASAWTIWEQKFDAGALGTAWAQTPVQRAIIAGRDIWFYLQKLAWPQPLIFIYPRWRIDASQPLEFLGLAAAVIIALVLLLWRNGVTRAVLFAFAYFVIALLPVLGFFDVFFFRYSFVSDHFQYLASIGPLALLAAALTFATQRIRILQYALSAAAVGAVGFLTWQQTANYSDAETLWRATLRDNPSCWMAHFELARIFRDDQQLDAAIEEYKQGIAIWPEYADAHYNLASIYLEKGDVDDAIIEYRIALRVEPNDADAHNNLGNALLTNGQLASARSEFETALRLRPDFAAAHENLARTLMQTGDKSGALAHLRTAVSLQPRDSHIRGELATTLLRAGRDTEAVAEFESALAIDHDDVAALTTYSWLLATARDPLLRDPAKARTLAEHAAMLTRAEDPLPLHSLAAACAASGEFDHAIQSAERAFDLALRSGNSALAEALTSELAAYRDGRPAR